MTRSTPVEEFENKNITEPSQDDDNDRAKLVKDQVLGIRGKYNRNKEWQLRVGGLYD
tara:strand:- start:613 stop:783 length:171 start_codon:yes stop_codon:yes gene_type:complete